MRLLTILLLAAATVALAPPRASAHDCNGYDCGPCVYGESHEHNDWRGQCSSGPDWYASNGYGGQRAEYRGHGWSNGWSGQRASPGAQALGTLLALGGSAALLGRRG